MEIHLKSGLLECEMLCGGSDHLGSRPQSVLQVTDRAPVGGSPPMHWRAVTDRATWWKQTTHEQNNASTAQLGAHITFEFSGIRKWSRPLEALRCFSVISATEAEKQHTTCDQHHERVVWFSRLSHIGAAKQLDLCRNAATPLEKRSFDLNIDADVKRRHSLAQGCSACDLCRDAAPIDLYMDAAPIDMCRDTEPIDLFRETAPIDLWRDAAPIDLQRDAAPINLCRNAAPIDLYREAAPIDLYRDATPIELYRDAADIDLYKDTAPIDLYRDRDAAPTDLCRDASPTDLCRDAAPIDLY